MSAQLNVNTHQAYGFAYDQIAAGWCVPQNSGRLDAILNAFVNLDRDLLWGKISKDCRVRMFFRWLARHNHILSNPASELELPRRERRLPKHVLTIQEAEAVINQPDIKDLLGIRDRAMLETFYSTGMRRMELVGLKLYDVNVERGTVLIRQGKGKKDRMIPVGDRALVWIEKYRCESRPSLVVEPDDGTLFLTKDGTPLIADHLSNLVKRYVEAANMGKTGACHLFRHTMATLMLEGGADVRYVQQMLGHSRLETTEVYTHVSIRTLKAVHSTTHPARMERTSLSPGAEQIAETETSADAATRDELLSLLRWKPSKKRAHCLLCDLEQPGTMKKNSP